MLIHRRVLEHTKMKEPFLRSTVLREVISEDLNFCYRARKAGFKVYTHFDYPCGHLKEVEALSLWRFISDMKADKRFVE